MPDSIKHASSVQQLKYTYLERNNDTFLSVMLDVFMYSGMMIMSCSILNDSRNLILNFG